MDGPEVTADGTIDVKFDMPLPRGAGGTMEPFKTSTQPCLSALGHVYALARTVRWTRSLSSDNHMKTFNTLEDGREVLGSARPTNQEEMRWPLRCSTSAWPRWRKRRV